MDTNYNGWILAPIPVGINICFTCEEMNTKDRNIEEETSRIGLLVKEYKGSMRTITDGYGLQRMGYKSKPLQLEIILKKEFQLFLN
jgi:hypothetical protein